MRPVLPATVLSLLALLAAAGDPAPATADGPWRAQIVDADTKQPLEGVVVLAVWTKHERGLGGASSEYHDSDEVLTDREGRFTIRARSFSSLNPMIFFRGPAFVIFKAGYGRAVWPGYDRLPQHERQALGTYAALLQRDRIVLSMPRLRTLEERKKYLDHVWDGASGVIPLKRMPLLQEMIRNERRAVGYIS